jgi:hypothetical protein
MSDKYSRFFKSFKKDEFPKTLMKLGVIQRQNKHNQN